MDLNMKLLIEDLLKQVYNEIKEIREEIKEIREEIKRGFAMHFDSIDQRFTRLSVDEKAHDERIAASEMATATTTPSPHGSQKWMHLSTTPSSSCLNSTSTSIRTSRVSGQPSSSLRSDLRLTTLMGTTSTKTTVIVGLGVFTP
jgi:hypothetical protein